MVDNRIQTIPGLGIDKDPIKAYHDLSTTRTTIKQLLADGTPDWVSHPEDYKEFVKENFAAHKQESDAMAEAYQWHDQHILADLGRKVNPISTRAFIDKLRKNGVKCFTVDNGWRGTVALWATPPEKLDAVRYVCYLQIPAMYEWSILNLDRHGIPDGEGYRGWRTVIVQLVEKEIITELQAHRIFGVPAPNENSARYFQSLWEKRNGKKYVDPEDEKN
ncbi:Uncharacterised protein [uncultured archaeon]|nr:Uncharacterised protein [uncultured archaeon]